MTSPVGTTEYEYDTLSGRLEMIISPQDKEFTFSYDRGQLESIARPNGITTSYAFDDNGNLTLIDHKLGASSLRSYEYENDKNGMRESMTDNDGLHDYTYDLLYQIIEATHPTVSNPLEEFDHDAVGNWLGNGRVHNELNQLTEDNDYYYEYDADGNMTVKVDKTTNDTTKFTWDIENRLIKVEKLGTIATYVYGPLGRRLRKVVNGIQKEFRYDGLDLILEMDDNDSIIVSYTFGPEIDQPLMMNRNNNNYYYLADGLGSITAITDESGNVLQEYKYSVFGEIVEQTADSIENPFTYTAREWETEIGLYYYRNRFYDPGIGRFISEDPIKFAGLDFNLYRYVRNSPVLFVDPFGLQCGPGNGFLEWLIPDEPLGYDFSDPCAQHDIAYRTPGRSKGECDEELEENLMNNCNGDPLCEQVAQVYVEAVVNFGDYAYHNAQSGGSVNILGNEMFAPDVTNIDIDLNSINPNE